MPLSIRYVSSLQDVVAPAIEFLSRDADLFAKPRIVVPNAGAKAWLWSRLAQTLGASRGGADGIGNPPRDGIVANVEIAYPGTIAALLQPSRGGEPDPWDFDRLTFAVLDVLAGPEARALDIPFDIAREPLLTARRIAGLFDEYHVRRPGMILEWDSATPSRHMQPTANDEQRGNVPVPDLIPDQDRWQYELWRLIRRRIAADSPPRRAGIAHRGPHAPLLVAGLQSLSWPQLEALQALATACHVEALLVHPSPGLWSVWDRNGPGPLEAALRGRPLRRNSRRSEAEAAEADEPGLPADVDPLPATWLAGAKELQTLVASQGVEVLPAAAEPSPAADSLLRRMQATIASGRLPDGGAHDPTHDHSVAIHRCHSLSRQAEVLHEALLHAFADPGLQGLQPHDVVILSPCLDEAAPHLEAVFQRSVAGSDVAGKATTISLPLVVADRGLRETSAGVDLLARLLALPGSRCSVDDVLGVAGHPLVRSHFALDDDTVAAWDDHLERAQVRWGLDHGHRERCGLAIVDPALHDVHTWKSGVEQMLLGAMLPDAVPRPELGGVVPLTDLDPADVGTVTRLIRVLDIVGHLARRAASAETAATWCDAIEAALTALCGERCRQLAEPLAQLRRLRVAALGAAADRLVGFDEIRTLLAEWFDEKAGRQPLHTGAITATSMVPLRGVPFRVVCVIGYDDSAFGAVDPSKDDLVARLPLVGDVDPRWESRRALLDCLLAAQDRLVIACTGHDVKTNEVVPLVTPLAELVDFAVRHGVGREKPTAPSAIEIDHPRHHLGRRNFLPGQVQPGITWSHDGVALEVATGAGKPAATGASGGNEKTDGTRGIASSEGLQAEKTDKVAAKPEIDITVLEQLVRDPLRLFLEHTLDISTWRDDESATPATLPLELEDPAARKLTEELIGLLCSQSITALAWGQALRQSGRLPLGPHGERQLREIVQLAEGMVAKAAKKAVPLTEFTNPSLGIELPRCRIVGRLEGVSEKAGHVVMHMARKVDRDSWGRPLHVAALRLLVASAAGVNVRQAAVVSRNGKWSLDKVTDTGRPIDPCQIRTIVLDPGLSVLQRLSQLCDLALEALAAPRALFGLHEVEPKDREQEFEAFVKARNWATGELLYQTKPEATVYGQAPVYASIFAPRSPEVVFLDSYQACLQLNGRQGSTEYTFR